MKKSELRKTILASMFIAIGIILPFLTANNQELGNMFSLMHIPVLLAGLILGFKYGLIVGLLTPIIRSLLIGMPPMMPIALTMMFELGAYGLFAGLLYKLLPKKDINVLITVALSMIIGRAIWGTAASVFYKAAGWNFSFKMFINLGFVTAAPGIAIQLVLIPILFVRLVETGVIERINEN